MNYTGQESKNNNNKQTNKQKQKQNKKPNVVHDSDTVVSLKQGQGRQTWYELVDPSPLPPKKKMKSRVSVREKAHDKVLSVLFLEYMRK